MLSTACPRVARALAAGQRRARFAAAFGCFRQRTIDRRYCGLLACCCLSALSERGVRHEEGWFGAAVQLVGGRPSSLCWVPASCQPAREERFPKLGTFSLMGGCPY